MPDFFSIIPAFASIIPDAFKCVTIHKLTSISSKTMPNKNNSHDFHFPNAICIYFKFN